MTKLRPHAGPSSLLLLLVISLQVACASGGTADSIEGEPGGACYDNNTCNDGYACEEDLCVIPEDRGDPDGVCYPNGTCNELYICRDGFCVDDQTQAKCQAYVDHYNDLECVGTDLSPTYCDSEDGTICGRGDFWACLREGTACDGDTPIIDINDCDATCN